MAEDRAPGPDDGPGSLAPLPAHLKHLPGAGARSGLALRQLFADQEHGLRQNYADWLLRLLGAQFLVADAVFVVFAWAGRGWNLPSGVIEVWLAATVFQVLGVVAVTRPFPNRAGRPG